MSDSARTMGVTVTMGAMTTLGAGTMLWMCTLTFFTKFAVLICSTILFSWSAALFFFMPLIAIVGPVRRHAQRFRAKILFAGTFLKILFAGTFLIRRGPQEGTQGDIWHLLGLTKQDGGAFVMEESPFPIIEC